MSKPITRAYKKQKFAEAKFLEQPDKMNSNVAFSKGFDAGWDAAMSYIKEHTISTSVLNEREPRMNHSKTIKATEEQLAKITLNKK